VASARARATGCSLRAHAATCCAWAPAAAARSNAVKHRSPHTCSTSPEWLARAVYGWDLYTNQRCPAWGPQRRPLHIVQGYQRGPCYSRQGPTLLYPIHMMCPAPCGSSAGRAHGPRPGAASVSWHKQTRGQVGCACFMRTPQRAATHGTQAPFSRSSTCNEPGYPHQHAVLGWAGGRQTWVAEGQQRQQAQELATRNDRSVVAHPHDAVLGLWTRASGQSHAVYGVGAPMCGGWSGRSAADMWRSARRE